MKTLSIVAITAFAFLGLANFASAQFQVSSDTFKNNDTLPIEVIGNRTIEISPGTFGNDCAPAPFVEGKNRSPALSWTNVPFGAQYYAVIAFDATAQVFHWGMYNINTRRLPENAGVEESTFGEQVRNYSRKLGYIGPCPPRNDPRGPHKYTFRVFALSQQTLGLPLNSDSAALSNALDAAIPLDTKSISGFWPSIPPTP